MKSLGLVTECKTQLGVPRAHVPQLRSTGQARLILAVLLASLNQATVACHLELGWHSSWPKKMPLHGRTLPARHTQVLPGFGGSLWNHRLPRNTLEPVSIHSTLENHCSGRMLAKQGLCFLSGFPRQDGTCEYPTGSGTEASMNAASGNDYQRVAQRPPANRTALGLNMVGQWPLEGLFPPASLEGAPSQHDQRAP